MRLALFSLLGLLFCSGAAAAADLTVTVRTTAGKPVADAVVTVHPVEAPAGQAIRFPWPMQIDQRDLQFDPFVLIVPVGGQVSFPNRDGVRHHVYSFSPAKRFELKLYGRDESRAVRFEKAGVVALGCNIHDSMVAFIKVVDTPYAAKSGASGAVALRGLPAGAAVVRIWHPYLRGPNNEIVRQLTLHDGALTEAVTVELRTPAVKHGAY
jgi:plastocyanin